MVRLPIRLPWKSLRDTPDGVISGAGPGGLCPVKDRTDPLLHAPRRLRLGEPDWREDFKHFRGVDLIDMTAPKQRKDIFPKRAEPLRSMLLVFPGARMLGMNRLCCLGESWHNSTLLPLLSNRIAALSCKLSVRSCLFPSLDEREELSAPEPMSRRRPWTTVRNIQRLAPEGSTTKYNPFPSAYGRAW